MTIRNLEYGSTGSKKLLLMFFFLIVWGCDSEQSMGLVYGEVIPYFAMSIELHEPIPRSVHREKLETAFGAAGVGRLGRSAHGPFARIEFWSPNPALDDGRQVTIIYDDLAYAKDPSVVRVFEVKYIFETIRNLDEQDWDLFEHWKNKVLPQAFPDAEITITTHPSRFTLDAQNDSV